MGVPITFMDKFNPEQFEIIGLMTPPSDPGIPELKTYDDYKEINSNEKPTGSSGKQNNGSPMLKGKKENKNYYLREKDKDVVRALYARIVIKNKNP